MQHEPVLTPVREAHRFDEAVLATWLGEQLGGDFSQMTVQQFEGGQSNPTFLLSTPERSLVLRKKPPGVLLRSAHAVDREYRAMSALDHSDVPVPQTHALCEDEGVIGTSFFVMEHIPGRVIADPRLPGLDTSQRSALYDHMVDVLAALHQLDYKACGLEEFGKPGNYYARQISRWSKQYKASQTEEIEAMETLMQWLPENIPDSDRTTLVHGDYRIGNCVVDEDQPRIVALLDWELSTLGHPMADLAYCCLPYYYIYGAGDQVLETGATGIPTEQAFLDRYAGITGHHPGKDWPFYLSFTMFRLAAIIQGVVRRGMDGNASSAHWSALKNECRKMAERAWEIGNRG